MKPRLWQILEWMDSIAELCRSMWNENEEILGE